MCEGGTGGETGAMLMAFAVLQVVVATDVILVM